jgi:hypothetical protein
MSKKIQNYHLKMFKEMLIKIKINIRKKLQTLDKIELLKNILVKLYTQIQEKVVILKNILLKNQKIHRIKQPNNYLLILKNINRIKKINKNTI